MATDMTIETHHGAVHAMITGSGPDLVLVHGTPWSSFSWHRVVPQLARSFRVHCYDLPGYGRSVMGDGQRVDLAIQGEVLAELLEHWQLDQPSVVGHDFGGAIALRAHLLHGRAYARLVLLDAVVLSPWGSPFFAHVQRHAAAFAGLPGYIHRAIVEAYIKGAIEERLDEADFRGLVEPWLTDAGKAAFYRQIAQADQRFTQEVTDKLARIDCPVMVAWGTNDPWIPVATGEQLHRAIPGSRFEPIAAAGHLPQLEAPDRVSELLLEFLAPG